VLVEFLYKFYLTMKNILLWILLFIPLKGIWAQSLDEYSLYIINDPDGYVNMRNGPGTEHDISHTKYNRTVIIKSNRAPTTKGWVPVVSLYKHTDGNIYENDPLYIFQNRLQPLNNSISSKLKKSIYKILDYGGGFTIQMLSDSMPDIFACYDQGNCELNVFDINTNQFILTTGIPVCFDILQGDTITFSNFYNGGDPQYPMLAIYKIYQKKDGGYDYYTEIFPEPRKVSKEKAEAIVKSIRKKMKDTQTKKEEFYLLPDFYLYCNQLFTAYCSGVNALDIISESGCDASICHDLDILGSMIDAYDRSKIARE